MITKNKISDYLNVTWLAITSILTFLAARFFFLGSEEDFIWLKKDLIENLIGRTLAVWVGGLVLVLLLVLIDEFVFKQGMKHSIKIGFYGLILTLILALAGSILFFNN